GYAAIDDAAFADRAVLMGAQIAQRPDPSSVAKDRDALAARGCDDPGSLVRYGLRRAHDEPAVFTRSGALVHEPLTPGRPYMQHADSRKPSYQHQRQERRAVELHGAERHVHHHQPIG